MTNEHKRFYFLTRPSFEGPGEYFCLRIKSTVGARGTFLNDLKRRNEEAKARREAHLNNEKDKLRKKALEIKENTRKKNLEIELVSSDNQLLNRAVGLF